MPKGMEFVYRDKGMPMPLALNFVLEFNTNYAQPKCLAKNK